MTELTAVLTELEDEWRRLNLPVARLLRPGLPADLVAGRVEELGLTSSQELRDWWGWHDGAASEGYRLSIGPGLFLETFEKCAAEHRRLSGFSWQPQLGECFPLVSELGGGMVIARCSKDDLSQSRVAYVDKIGQVPPDEDWLPSMHALVRLWLERLRSGLWVVGESGYAIESREDASLLPRHLQGLL